MRLNPPAGDNLGIRVRRPRPQSLRVLYRQKSIAASFGLPPRSTRSIYASTHVASTDALEVQHPEVIPVAPY